MKKLNLYIDGFNLYFGLRTYGDKYKWLDVMAVGRELCRTDQTLGEVKYFTARIKGDDKSKIKRQTTYLEALATMGVTIIEGKYLKKKVRCPVCKKTYSIYEEKESDVNLATELLKDAVAEMAEVYMLVSGDSDLILPMETARDEYKQRVIPVFPPNRHSSEIKRRVGTPIIFGERLLRKCQLPAVVTKADGYKLHRPSAWKL